jgi:hypothetical protein
MPDAKRTPCERRPTRIAAPLVVFALALTGGPLRAALPPAIVKGKIAGWEKLVPQVYVDAAKSESHRYTWREPSPTVKHEFRRLSANPSRDVCVAAMSASPSQPHEAISVKVTGGRITPATLVLSPGSRISFKNDDPFPHVLYEVGNDKWAPNPTAPGSTREWAASTPGLREIRDQLLPSVVAYVVVDPAAVDFASPDRDGAFSLSLPAGDYTLKTFFDGKPVGHEVPGIHLGDHGVLELREPLALGGDAK